MPRTLGGTFDPVIASTRDFWSRITAKFCCRFNYTGTLRPQLISPPSATYSACTRFNFRFFVATLAAGERGNHRGGIPKNLKENNFDNLLLGVTSEPPSQDWTKSLPAAKARLAKIRERLRDIRPRTWPRQNIDPARWGIFLMDVNGCEESIYMMKFGAFIPLAGHPFLNDPLNFPKMEA